MTIEDFSFGLFIVISVLVIIGAIDSAIQYSKDIKSIYENK